MCIVFLDWRSNWQWPIMVAANREENRFRPIGVPIAKRHMFGDTPMPYIVAGEDRDMTGKADTVGTWLGVNSLGMVIAVTNRDDGKIKKKEEMSKSRGVLCHELLTYPSVLTASERCVRELKGGGYGGCNYIILDSYEGCVIHAPGDDSVTIQQLKEGIHCITNLDMDDPDDERVQCVRKHLRSNLDVEHFVGLAKSICTHESILVTDPNHGTVASSVIAVGREKTLFHHYVGMPTIYDAYVDLSHMTQNFCVK